MPQPTTNYQQKQMIRKFAADAAELKRQGYPDHKIIQELINKGVERETVYEIIGSLSTADDGGQRAAARQRMITGALICIFGILMTVVTYSVAAANGGGSYVVAVGAILVGGFRFFRGLAAYNR